MINQDPTLEDVRLVGVEVIPPSELIAPDRFSKVKGGLVIDIESVRACAACCMTVAETAAHLGISRKGLENRIKTDPKLKEAFENGRASGIAKVKIAVFQKALDGSVPAQALILRTQADWIEKPKQSLVAQEVEKPRTLDLKNFTVQELQDLRAKFTEHE